MVNFNYELKNEQDPQDRVDTLGQHFENFFKKEWKGFAGHVEPTPDNDGIYLKLTRFPLSDFPIKIYNGYIELDVEKLSKDEMNAIVDMLGLSGIHNFNVKGDVPTADGIAPKHKTANNVDWDKRRYFASRLYWRDKEERMGWLPATVCRIYWDNDHPDQKEAKKKTEKYEEAFAKRLLLGKYPPDFRKKNKTKDGWLIFTCFDDKKQMGKDGKLEIDTSKSFIDLLKNPPEPQYTYKVRVGARRRGDSLEFFAVNPNGTVDMDMFKQMLSILPANGYHYIELPEVMLRDAGTLWKSCGARLIIPMGEGINIGRDEATVMMNEALGQIKSDKEKRDFLGRLVKELKSKNPKDDETLLTIQKIETKMIELVSPKGMTKTQVEIIQPKLKGLMLKVNNDFAQQLNGKKTLDDADVITMHRLYNKMIQEIYHGLDDPKSGKYTTDDGTQTTLLEILKKEGSDRVLAEIFTKEEFDKERKKVIAEIKQEYDERKANGTGRGKTAEDLISKISRELRDVADGKTESICSVLENDFSIQLPAKCNVHGKALRVGEIDNNNNASRAYNMQRASYRTAS